MAGKREEDKARFAKKISNTKGPMKITRQLLDNNDSSRSLMSQASSDLLQAHLNPFFSPDPLKPNG
jgi:hypothetical protein